MIEKELTEQIIGAAMEVHSYWGPGLLESIYEKSLYHELTLQGIEVRRQVPLNLKYKGLALDDDFRVDLIVEGKAVVELKVVKDLQPVHEAQLLTYMKLTNSPVGLLINFNVASLKHGIKRMVLSERLASANRNSFDSTTEDTEATELQIV